jgi:hypothetical protein
MIDADYIYVDNHERKIRDRYRFIDIIKRGAVLIPLKDLR